MGEADPRPDPDLGPRWTDGPLLGRGDEARAIALFREATALPPFSAVSSQRVWRRLSQARGPETANRRLLRPAVLLGLLLGAGAAAAASVAVIRVLSKPAAPRLEPAAPAPRRALASPVSTAAPSAPLVIRASDVPAVTAKSKRRLRRDGAVKRASQKEKVVVVAAPVDEGAFGKETTLFREALSLRAARDPRGAIAVLDRYAALYPRGSFAAEVVVLRAELAADAGDCAAATANFDRALSVAASPGLEERALYGRASCRLSSGDRPAARADFERYLQRFPHGRYAGHARAALAR